MKKRHRKYTEISLRYVQSFSPFSETEIMLANYFGEESSLWQDDYSLQLRLSLDGKTIWSTCDINVLLEMYLKTGKYYPFTCDDCGIPECAGVYAPCRIIHCGEDIILSLRSPLQENSSKRWRYRAYRLRKKDFLKELLGVIHFRISLENILNINIDDKDQTTALLIKTFGIFDTQEYQYKISQKIRMTYPKLKNELLKTMVVKRNDRNKIS